MHCSPDRPRALQRAEAEGKFMGEMQARRNETANQMQELQTCAASKHPIPPCTIIRHYAVHRNSRISSGSRQVGR